MLRENGSAAVRYARRCDVCIFAKLKDIFGRTNEHMNGEWRVVDKVGWYLKT